MMDHGKLAEENFRKGYNCAQSVLLAFGMFVLSYAAMYAAQLSAV